MSIKAVLFDLDGTLIDSAPDLGAAADKMRTDRGLPAYPLEQYRQMAGAGATGMLKVAFNLIPEDDSFPIMREEFFCNYEACMTQRTTLFDGVQEMIKELQAREIPWGIVTNKSERFTVPLMKISSWAASAKALVGGDTTPYMKPHPAPVLEGARQLGAPAQACLYVGDDLRDIQAGNAAGMITAAATWGYLGLNSDCATWGAHHVIDSPMDLLKLL